jgi:DNA-binding response OmpR family regulator
MDLDRSRKRVVVLEDDRDVATLLIEILTSEGFDALRADAQTSAEQLAQHQPRLLVIDLTHAPETAAEVLGRLRSVGLAQVPVLVLSGAPDLDRHAQAFGAAATVSKPFDIDALVGACRSLAN